MAKSPSSNITLSQFRKGCATYWKGEPRDAMYRIATRLVQDDWANPADIADALGVVLLTWNQAAYRYDKFDFAALEKFLRAERAALEVFRSRHIESFDPDTDAESIKALFNEALEALRTKRNKKRSPVAVAKTLHIIAPHFFPLWEGAIAKGRSCYWYRSAGAARKYLAFMKDAQDLATALETQYRQSPDKAGLPPAKNLAAALSRLCGRPKTFLKCLDEYLYAKHTGKWI